MEDNDIKVIQKNVFGQNTPVPHEILKNIDPMF